MSLAVPNAEVVLPLLLPARAEALWVGEPKLATALAAAGFRITSESPDVAVVTAAGQLTDAPPTEEVVAIVDGMTAAPSAGGRVGDAVARLGAHARMRLQVAALRRRLHQGGWPEPELWWWDAGSAVWAARPTPRTPVHRASRYLRRAAVVSGPRGPRLLEEALHEAARTICGPASTAPAIDRVVLSEGSTVVLTDLGVLRFGLGSRAGQVDHPARILRALQPVLQHGPLRAAVPDMLATGQVGRLRWSLENRKPGAPVEPPLTAAQWRSCVELQVALHALPADVLPPGQGLSHLAELVAGHAGNGELVLRLAMDAEERLRPLRSGVNHGDFWHSNLLGDPSGITGLLDWDSARGAGFPFVDLLHLYTASAERPGRDSWGKAVVGQTLPWLTRADDPHLLGYARGIGVEPAPDILGATAVAYWLLHLGYQLSRYQHRRSDPRWLATNIDRVAAELEQFTRRGR